MTLALLSVRPIDLAIFASLGGLWIFGALFIFVLYRWIIRFERQNGAEPPPEAIREPSDKPTREAARPRPRLQPVHVRSALGQQA